METIVVFTEGKFLTRSKAVKYIFKNLSGYPKFFGFLLELFPTLLSDYFYKLFANYRYKVFIKKMYVRSQIKIFQIVFLNRVL